MRWVMMVSVIAHLAGCASLSGSYCELTKPIWWDDQAQLDATPTPIVRQIVAHNERYKAVCR